MKKLKIYNLALKDLDEALLYALESNIKHIESKKFISTSGSIKTLIYYQTERRIYEKYQKVVEILTI